MALLSHTVVYHSGPPHTRHSWPSVLCLGTPLAVLHLGHVACTQHGNSPGSKQGQSLGPSLVWPPLADVQCLGNSCFLYFGWVFKNVHKLF